MAHATVIPRFLFVRKKGAEITKSALRRWPFRPGPNGRPETLAADNQEFDILSLNEAIDMLADLDRSAADLAKLRIFAGLSVDEAAAALGIPHTSAYRQWTYAQAWLRARLGNTR